MAAVRPLACIPIGFETAPGLRVPDKVPLRVALVTPGGLGQRGGIGSASRILAETAAARHGIAFHVLDPWRSGFLPGQLLATAVALIRLIWLVLARRIDVVHVNMAGGASLLRKSLFVATARLLGRPCVVHLHASRLDLTYGRLPRWLRRAFRGVLGMADAVVTLGGPWRRFALDVLGLEWARVRTIPNGVPDPGASAAPAKPEPTVRLVFLGRLGERKGTAILLEALNRAELAGTSWSLTLAGDGDLRGAERLAAQLGIADRCAVLGWLDPGDVARLLRGADILVLPSRHEGLSMAVLEAMAHGLAVVTTRAGALADAIEHEQTGLLVPADAPRELAAALRRLIDRPELRRRLGAAARARYLERFSAERMADSFGLLYAELARRAHFARVEVALAARPSPGPAGRPAPGLTRPPQAV